MPGDVDFFNLVFGSAVYTEPARLRADDLLVRGRAQEPLGSAAALLRDVAARYQREVVPPASPERPFPDPATVAPMRRADQARAAIESCRDAIRGLVAPGADHVWDRHRRPTPLLALLVAADRQLIFHSDRVAEALKGLTADTLVAFDLGPCDAALAELRRALEERRRLTRLET